MIKYRIYVLSKLKYFFFLNNNYVGFIYLKNFFIDRIFFWNVIILGLWIYFNEGYIFEVNFFCFIFEGFVLS